jgi:hypothetical protein
MIDFNLIKLQNISLGNYSIRFRYKLGLVEDFNNFISSIFLDTYRGIYLPLTINFKFLNKSLNNAQYLLMAR